MTCSSCTYWTQTIEIVDVPVEPSDEPAEILCERGECSRAIEPDFGPATDAMFVDGTDAVLVTGPDFGCIHHEERE